jgi:hypothetical protein
MTVDYGPLAALVGTWRGDKGMDVAHDPAGREENPYFETITFTPIGDVTNANTQVLVGLRYHQSVRRKSTGLVFHDQTGYWMWEVATGTVIESLLIPRAVGVLAGGRWKAGPRRPRGRVGDRRPGLGDRTVALHARPCSHRRLPPPGPRGRRHAHLRRDDRRRHLRNAVPAHQRTAAPCARSAPTITAASVGRMPTCSRT